MTWWTERIVATVWFGAWAGMVYAIYIDYQYAPGILKSSMARNEMMLEDMSAIQSNLGRIKSDIADIDRIIKSRSVGISI